MLMAGYGVAAGRMTIGEFVMVNAYLLRFYFQIRGMPEAEFIALRCPA